MFWVLRDTVSHGSTIIGDEEARPWSHSSSAKLAVTLLCQRGPTERRMTDPFRPVMLAFLANSPLRQPASAVAPSLTSPGEASRWETGLIIHALSRAQRLFFVRLFLNHPRITPFNVAATLNDVLTVLYWAGPGCSGPSFRLARQPGSSLAFGVSSGGQRGFRRATARPAAPPPRRPAQLGRRRAPAQKKPQGRSWQIAVPLGRTVRSETACVRT
jgi:hypothetical protein